MAAQSSKAKSSGWGSLLSGAVAGLESRLDAVLGDDDQASAKSRAADEALKQARQAALKADNASSRTPSRNRTNDRLQERLAKAMADKAAHRPSSATPSNTAGSVLATEKEGRPSFDSVDASGSLPLAVVDSTNAPGKSQAIDMATITTTERNEIAIPGTTTSELRPSDAITEGVTETHVKSLDPASFSLSEEVDRASTDSVAVPATPPTSAIVRPSSDSEARPSDIIIDYQTTLNGYLERIDALHAKITYLAKTASVTCREDAQTAEPGSLRSKLAEKDEKIAELIKEGTSLSSKEVKAMTLVRTLRERVREVEAAQTKLRTELETTGRQATDAKEQILRAGIREKAMNEQLKTLPRLQREAEALTADKVILDALILELRRQLVDAEVTSNDSQTRLNAEGAAESVNRIKNLEIELSTSQEEKREADNRARLEMKDQLQAMSRQQEQAARVEGDLRAEVQNLESKLELLRLQHETSAVESPAVAQSHLLRQVEILQGQYDMATQNWQGIENGFNTRIAGLEKDRDDLTKREADARRKARDVSSKVRKLEDELDLSREKVEALDSEIVIWQRDSANLQAKLLATEQIAQQSKAELEKQKALFDETLQARIDEVTAKLRLELPTINANVTSPSEVGGPQYLRAESPTAYFRQRKHSTVDVFGFGSRRNPSSNGSRALGQSEAPAGLAPLTMDNLGRPPSRRTASQTPSLAYFSNALRSPIDSISSSRYNSVTSLTQFNGRTLSTTPSIDVQEETAERADSASSPHRTINDLVSVSTVGAGPSVQLVERMSAAVRRLESEKAASKEEMARLLSQRDEAREDIVQLMRRTEALQASQDRLTSVESETTVMKQKYDLALEMVGEKSEECDELRADLADLKRIYRELVDSTMK